MTFECNRAQIFRNGKTGRAKIIEATMTRQANATLQYNNTKQPLISQDSSAAVTLLKKSARKSCRSEEKKRNIKCVIIGDKAVGKTSLAVSYSNDTFPLEYVPTAYDNYNVVVQVDGKPIRVEICDTAGDDEFNPLRSLCYPGADVFMLCFSLSDPSSFDSAWSRWPKEIGKLGVPIILVGTKSDIGNHPEIQKNIRLKGEMPVDQSQVATLAEKLKAPYIETSAKCCFQLKEAFDKAIMVALNYNMKKKRKWWRKLCCI